MRNVGSKTSLISMLVCIVLLASSISLTTGQVPVAEDDTYTLRVAMQDDVRTLNPLVAGDVWTWNLVGYLYESPMITDPETDELIPYIAVGSANGTASQGSMAWEDCTIGIFDYSPQGTWNNSERPEATIFYDFTGVTWHDGEQMDIRDVMFSHYVQSQMPHWVSGIKCLMDEGGEPGSNFTDTHYLHIQKVYESADGLQAALKFELQVPFIDFFKNTLSTFLLPYHIWGTTVSGQASNDMLIWCDDGYVKGGPNAWNSSKAMAWDNPGPIGSGVFKFDSWTVGSNSKIIKNTDHFYKPGWNPLYDPDEIAKQPTIEAIQFKIYRTAEQAVLALKNNEIDYIAWSIPPTFIHEIANDPALGVKQSAERGFFYMAYNMRPSRRSFGYDENGTDVGKPLRKTIAHCIDKQTIVQRLLQNFGIPGDGILSNLDPMYNISIQKYAFDPEEAKNILANAGYKLTDPGAEPGVDNWWLNPDGSPIGNGEGGLIEILTPPMDYDPIRCHAGLMIARQMQDIGLYAEHIALDFGTIVNRIDARDFDMYILGWRIGAQPMDYMYSFFHSSNGEIGDNYPGYRNITFDNLIYEARITDNESYREELIKEAQAAIAYDLPYDVLYFKTNIEVFRADRFTGWQTGSSGSIYNWGSIINLRPPSNSYINARFVNTALSMYSEGELDVEVLVTSITKNDDGTLTRATLEGAEVQFSVSNGTLDQYNCTSDAYGKVKLKFTAPHVDPDNPLADEGLFSFIEISTASKEGYDDARSRVHIVGIYKTITPFLNLEMELDPDVIEDVDTQGQEGITYITVTARDNKDVPVKNCAVSFETIPEGANITQIDNVTNDQGEAVARLSANMDIEEDEIVVVVAKATMLGYQNGTQSIWLDVINGNIIGDIIGEPPLDNTTDVNNTDGTDDTDGTDTDSSSSDIDSQDVGWFLGILMISTVVIIAIVVLSFSRSER